MVFSELAFLFHFFPIFLIVYYIARGKARNIVLLLGSLIFYALGNPLYVLLLIASVLVNYLVANRIQTIFARIREADPWRDEDEFIKENDEDPMDIIDLDEDDETDLSKDDAEKKLEHKPAAATIWLITGLIYNLGVLCIFKYLDFILEVSDSFFATGLKGPNLALPLGISFYTFQMISFIVDVYREDTESRVSFLHFAAYSTMFPQIASGPITRYGEVKETLDRVRGVKAAYLEKGMIAFTLGLGYKVLLADKIAALWNDVWRVGALGIDVATAWLGAWGYSMQIYFDFWGYSLMAMGVAGMLGFNLPVNFTEPYSSKTMTSFWRNWHVTLGRWFKDYLYIPMGGNRCGKVRMLFNMLVVWLLTGLWHGADWTYVCWGLLFFAVLLTEKLTGLAKWMEKHSVGHLYAMVLVTVITVLIRSSSISAAFGYMKTMFGFGGAAFADRLTWFMFKEYLWYILAAVVCSLPLGRFIKRKLRIPDGVWEIACGVAIACVMLVAVANTSASGYNPFIYYNF